jgi:hypothetical protein
MLGEDAAHPLADLGPVAMSRIGSRPPKRTPMSPDASPSTKRVTPYVAIAPLSNNDRFVYLHSCRRSPPEQLVKLQPGHPQLLRRRSRHATLRETRRAHLKLYVAFAPTLLTFPGPPWVSGCLSSRTGCRSIALDRP